MTLYKTCLECGFVTTEWHLNDCPVCGTRFGEPTNNPMKVSNNQIKKYKLMSKLDHISGIIFTGIAYSIIIGLVLTGLLFAFLFLGGGMLM